ncbi:MAG: carboxypeptidase regulatory-like domain-containing protein [Pyrinomonadaceae bacterium]
MLNLTSVRFLSGALALFALFAVAPAAAFAQTSGSATLRGTVKDAAGAIVPASTVTITSNRTSAERKLTTGDEGSFTFPSLDPGTYTLRVEAANFKTYVQTDLTLSPSDTRGADVTLEAGGASETVTVTADATNQIQTETGEKSSTITAAQIENLSLIGRSSMELLRILPGVVAPDGPDLQVVGFGTGANNTAAYSVNGLRGTNNNVSIDGSRVIDIGSNSGTIITPNNDMVQEVKVQTSNYAAEFGSSGVQITATTKGGGNEYHGTLYTYARPYQLQANDRQRVLQGLFPGRRR